MIFLFCSVYSTCRCPFFFAKLLPGRMVKYRHANRQRTERQLSANQRFGYFGAPDKPCGVGRADANPKLLLNDT